MRYRPLDPAGTGEGSSEAGFSLIELVIASAIMIALMTSLAYVMVNSVVDTAFNRQRSTAISLANQAVEEVRSLGWATIVQGLQPSDPNLCSDTNIFVSGVCGSAPSAYCFQNQPLDVGGSLGAAASCKPVRWSDPSCLSESGTALPSVLSSPAPISPHQQCYDVGGRVYGVQVYLTGATGTPVAPLTLTVVVSWARPGRAGLSDHAVTTTELSGCSTVGTAC